MLALFGNISGLEVGLIVLLAVMIFGSRLPEVASRVYTQFRRFREGVDRFRRDTGIDREMREIQRSVRDAAWRKDIQINLEAPEHETQENTEASMPAQNVPARRSTQAALPGDPYAQAPEEQERTKDVGLSSDAEGSAEPNPEDTKT